MLKTLTNHENRLAPFIEKLILDILDVTVDTPFEVTSDEQDWCSCQ